jgi:murein DD-endopeptidase MepM/ murein hydrolase activator NlpD
VGLTTGHPGWHRYGIDFLMPIGSGLIAARSGKAQEIKEDAFDWDHDLEDGNYLLVLHEDGTLAMYGHLTHDGVLVERGEHVGVGQVIARSGHSGQSTAPHLHFEVMRCPLGAPPCESVPVLFRNTAPTPCGVQVGVSYPAWAF